VNGDLGPLQVGPGAPIGSLGWLLYYFGPMKGFIPTSVQIKATIDAWLKSSNIQETLTDFLESQGYWNQGSLEQPDWVRVSGSALGSLDFPVGAPDYLRDDFITSSVSVPTLPAGVIPRVGTISQNPWLINEPFEITIGGLPVEVDPGFILDPTITTPVQPTLTDWGCCR